MLLVIFYYAAIPLWRYRLAELRAFILAVWQGLFKRGDVHSLLAQFYLAQSLPKLAILQLS